MNTEVPPSTAALTFATASFGEGLPPTDRPSAAWERQPTAAAAAPAAFPTRRASPPSSTRRVASSDLVAVAVVVVTLAEEAFVPESPSKATTAERTRASRALGGWTLASKVPPSEVVVMESGISVPRTSPPLSPPLLLLLLRGVKASERAGTREAVRTSRKGAVRLPPVVVCVAAAAAKSSIGTEIVGAVAAGLSRAKLPARCTLTEARSRPARRTGGRRGDKLTCFAPCLPPLSSAL